MTRHLIPALVLPALLAAAAAGQTASERLHDLFDARHRWQLAEFPEMAMARGDYSTADRIADVSLEAIERRHRQNIAFLGQLHEIDRAKLNATDRISYELFALELGNGIEGHRFRTFLAPIGGRFGPHQSIPQMAERVRFASVTDYENYLTRLELVPGRIDDLLELLRTGLAEGRTPPRVTLLGVPGQFEALLQPGGLDALAAPFNRFPAHVGPDEQARLRRRFEEVSIPAVHGALARLGRFLSETYLPGCREGIAATDWPDGEAYYGHQLRVMTTTELTARQIHEIGLAEVARIRAEMLQVIRSSDFMEHHAAASSLDDDELFRAFVEYLRTSPRFYCTTEDELLRRYRDICKRIDAWMPKFFATLPRLPYGVRKIPDFMAPSQTTAYYSPGDIRNAEPGYFYANTYALDQRPTYEMIALAMHEAVPGHHHQIAIAQEMEGLPEFRQDAYLTAFGEGWALYAERLGLEMDLYDDPYDDFGRLTYEMWRACRLVVDPGMHALGWTREQAIQFMLDNSALTPLNIETEVDRYIAWPGQATGYKIGELKIRGMRTRAEAVLGQRFDIRRFHDVVLTAGALPLPLLDQRVNEWIEAVQRGEDPDRPRPTVAPSR